MSSYDGFREINRKVGWKFRSRDRFRFASACVAYGFRSLSLSLSPYPSLFLSPYFSPPFAAREIKARVASPALYSASDRVFSERRNKKIIFSQRTRDKTRTTCNTVFNFGEAIEPKFYRERRGRDEKSDRSLREIVASSPRLTVPFAFLRSPRKKIFAISAGNYRLHSAITIRMRIKSI